MGSRTLEGALVMIALVAIIGFGVKNSNLLGQSAPQPTAEEMAHADQVLAVAAPGDLIMMPESINGGHPYIAAVRRVDRPNAEVHIMTSGQGNFAINVVDLARAHAWIVKNADTAEFNSDARGFLQGR